MWITRATSTRTILGTRSGYSRPDLGLWIFGNNARSSPTGSRMAGVSLELDTKWGWHSQPCVLEELGMEREPCLTCPMHSLTTFVFLSKCWRWVINYHVLYERSRNLRIYQIGGFAAVYKVGKIWSSLDPTQSSFAPSKYLSCVFTSPQSLLPSYFYGKIMTRTALMCHGSILPNVPVPSSPTGSDRNFRSTSPDHCHCLITTYTSRPSSDISPTMLPGLHEFRRIRTTVFAAIEFQNHFFCTFINSTWPSASIPSVRVDPL